MPQELWESQVLMDLLSDWITKNAFNSIESQMRCVQTPDSYHSIEKQARTESATITMTASNTLESQTHLCKCYMTILWERIKEEQSSLPWNPCRHGENMQTKDSWLSRGLLWCDSAIHWATMLPFSG